MLNRGRGLDLHARAAKLVRRLSLTLVVGAAAAGSMSVGASYGPSVSTDRTSYPAGDVIEISASGFAAGEPVTVQVTHADGTAEPGAGHEAWSATADATGALLDTWTIDANDSAGSSFLVTVTGPSGSAQSPAFLRRAVVETGQPGYPAGEPIDIRGRGFTPGEAVTLQVTHAGGGSEPGMGHEEWTATAAADGSLAATWSIDAADASGDELVLAATGATSGPAASASFARSGFVRTNKTDYQPGETALISGGGFAPNEEVTLQVTHANGLADGGGGHVPFATIADAEGGIAASWYVDPDDSLGSKFLLTAKGVGSGRKASAVFWDAGTVSLTTFASAYTQDFNTLASSGTANTTTPTGWEFSESGTNANTTYRAGTGSDTAGDTYSFGATSNTERAFGGLRSGTLVPLLGAQFTNNTGGTINSLAIAYTGEQWRLGQNTTGRAADRLDFQLSTNATSLTTGTWTDYDSLDFSSPVLAGTVGALNGNVAPNRTALSFTITGLSIPNGTSFWVRWADSDLIPGSDDGLAIDDFSLTPDGVANPVRNLSISDVSLNEGNSGTTSFSFTVSLSAPAGAGGVTFDIATADNTAAAPGDYTAKSLAGQTISEGSSSYTFSVLVNGDATAEADETFFVNVTNVTGATVLDGQGQGTIVNEDINFCELPFTSIPSIQGSGATVALTGTQTTQGVVVGDYEGPSPALRGFFIQDPNGDGNPATSDGIFVFEGSNANTVSVGDVVRVTGTAAENQGQSQISVGTIVKCGTATVTPTPTDVTFPVASADFLERYEGMLVRLPQTMYVTEHFQLGRFGQVVLSSGARLQQPTNVTTPGAPALALQAQNDLNKIILDDASQVQNPDPILFARGGQPLSASNTLRGGDTATGIVGVLNYTWGGNSASPNAYRIRPIGALGGSVSFEPANPRPESAPSVGGTVRVVSMNLLNFFNTFDGLPDSVDNCGNGVGGAATDCRGADTQAELDRQWPKTVAAILAMNPDVLAVNEIENDGYGPGSAIQFLVDKLNAASAPGTWAFIDVDTNTSQLNAMGTDAIKVAQLYKPAVVTPVGQTAPLNTVAFVNGGDSVPRARPSLAQAFQVNATGARFIVAANHFKSKGSACDTPDAGDGQGNCNVVRTNSANALTAWLATDPTGTGDPDVLIVGDLNSYAKEDPVTAIQNAGFTNLIESLLGPDAYSYVFDGQWGYLDHALASASLVAQVAGVGDFHVNADEPSVLDYNTDFKTPNLQATLYAPDQFRISDHDPVVIGLTPNASPTVDAGGPYSVDEGGSVTLTATGSDPNGDTLTYAWDLDNNGSFETPGESVSFSAALLDGPSAFTVNVRVTDSGGLSSDASATVNVVNVKPTVSTPTVTPEPSTEGSSVVASAAFSDPAGDLDAPFTCTVDYGDGSGAQAGTVSGNTCEGPAHAYASFGSYTVTVSVTDDDGGTGSKTASHVVEFNWSGFFEPVDNLPTVNTVKAGSAIPVKFGLGGNKGLAIFAPGYPRSVPFACPPRGKASEDSIEQTVTAGGSSLSYDPLSGQYNYVWKSEKAWAGTCRELQVKLVDDTMHAARFRFQK